MRDWGTPAVLAVDWKHRRRLQLRVPAEGKDCHFRLSWLIALDWNASKVSYLLVRSNELLFRTQQIGETPDRPDTIVTEKLIADCAPDYPLPSVTAHAAHFIVYCPGAIASNLHRDSAKPHQRHNCSHLKHTPTKPSATHPHSLQFVARINSQLLIDVASEKILSFDAINAANTLATLNKPWYLSSLLCTASSSASGSRPARRSPKKAAGPADACRCLPMPRSTTSSPGDTSQSSMQPLARWGVNDAA